MWYEDTPTIWSHDGVTEFIQCHDEHYPKDVESQKYVKACKDRGEHVSIPTRMAAVSMLDGVAAEDIVAAGVPADIMDVRSDEHRAQVVPFDDFEKVKEISKKVKKG